MTEAELTGIGHIALNVKDLVRSVQGYGEVLGFAPLFPFHTDDFDRQILMHGSGAVIALTRHHHPWDQPFLRSWASITMMPLGPRR